MSNYTENGIPPEGADTLYPVSYSISADLLLQIVYALFLGLGSRLISSSIELMMEVVSVGLVGGFVLPVLGTLPDAIIIFFSTMGSGDTASIQNKLAVGVGSLAGSNIFLLTIPFAISIYKGRCDIVNGVAVNKQYTKFSWTKTGVSTLPYTRTLARIMILTVFPYLIIQLSFLIFSQKKYDHSSMNYHERYWAFSTFIICFLGFLAYSIYQLYDVRYQEKKLNAARKRFLWEQFYKHMSIQLKRSVKTKALERSTSSSKVEDSVGLDIDDNNNNKNNNNINNSDLLPSLEKTSDSPMLKSKRRDLTRSDYLHGKSIFSNLLTKSESVKNLTIPTKFQYKQKLSASTSGIKSISGSNTINSIRDTKSVNDSPSQSKPIGTISDTKSMNGGLSTRKTMDSASDINNSSNNNSDDNDNDNGLECSSYNGNDNRFKPMDDLPTVHEEMEHVYEGLKNKIQHLDEDDLLKHSSDHQIIDLSIDYQGIPEKPKHGDKRNIIIKSIIYLLLGTGIIMMFADAFVESITRFSERIHIRSFYISFIVAPFALNSSEMVTAWYLSLNKKRKHISLVHSSLYGAISMNNLISLGTLLFMIYFRNLVWSFSAECLVILITTVSIGLLGSFKSTFNIIHCVLVLLIFPFSILLVILLESNKIGWG